MHALDAQGTHHHRCNACGRTQRAPVLRLEPTDGHTFHVDCPCGASESFAWHDWVYTDDGVEANPEHLGARQMAVTKRVAPPLGLRKRQNPYQRVPKDGPDPVPHTPEELKVVKPWPKPSSLSAN